MTASATNRFDEVHSSEVLPGSIGRGSGMTIKEFNRRLTLFMRKRGIPNTEMQWRSRSRREAEVAGSGGIHADEVAPLKRSGVESKPRSNAPAEMPALPVRVCRIRKACLWAQL
jgi:hypothetical protein